MKVSSRKEPMKTAFKDNPNAQFDDSCKPLLDHLASELAKEYVRLMKQSAAEEQNTINTENNACVLQFTPATAQKASAKRA